MRLYDRIRYDRELVGDLASTNQEAMESAIKARKLANIGLVNGSLFTSSKEYLAGNGVDQFLGDLINIKNFPPEPRTLRYLESAVLFNTTDLRDVYGTRDSVEEFRSGISWVNDCTIPPYPTCWIEYKAGIDTGQEWAASSLSKDHGALVRTYDLQNRTGPDTLSPYGADPSVYADFDSCVQELKRIEESEAHRPVNESVSYGDARYVVVTQLFLPMPTEPSVGLISGPRQTCVKGPRGELILEYSDMGKWVLALASNNISSWKLALSKGSMTLAQARDVMGLNSVGEVEEFLSGSGEYYEKVTTRSLIMLSQHLRFVGYCIRVMCCKNVQYVDNVPSPALEKAFVRRHSRPMTRYKTLELAVSGESVDVARRIGEKRQSLGLMPVHTCRGHFAEYGPMFGKGLLFGKYEGRFWVPPHLKGSKASGVVYKEYKVTKKEKVKK